MDAGRFDTLTRAFTTARLRRGTLVSLLGGALGLVGLTETDAHNALKRCKKIEDKDKRRKCKKKAKKHNATHVAPVPAGCVPNCTGKECGANGCNGSCGSCAGDQLCA